MVVTEYGVANLIGRTVRERAQALIEIAHWFDVVFVLCLCALFWSTSWVGMAILLVVTYLLEIVIDNVTARMTWRWMLGYVWAMGLTLSLVNLIWLYAAR